MNTSIFNGKKWFFLQIKLGVRYALYFMIISFIMGMMYGLFGGLVYEPGLFATSLIGMFCIINFPFAILAVVFNLLLSFFNKGHRAVYRYFGLSFGFAAVFLLYFYLLHLLKIEVF